MLDLLQNYQLLTQPFLLLIKLSRFFFFVNIFSLATLSIFSKSGPTKVGKISSLPLTPESDKDSNHDVKIESVSIRRSSTLYQKRHSERNSYRARKYLLLYQINLVT